MIFWGLCSLWDRQIKLHILFCGDSLFFIFFNPRAGSKLYITAAAWRKRMKKGEISELILSRIKYLFRLEKCLNKIAYSLNIPIAYVSHHFILCFYEFGLFWVPYLRESMYVYLSMPGLFHSCGNDETASLERLSSTAQCLCVSQHWYFWLPSVSPLLLLRHCFSSRLPLTWYGFLPSLFPLQRTEVSLPYL